ncbi:unnamed protein product [Pedinophyceae sp. YPF-701]|nr:unnamed protein product [Pedinophyceae sp. YPF-701]
MIAKPAPRGPRAPSTGLNVSRRAARGQSHVCNSKYVKDSGAYTLQGSVRKVNEDRIDVRSGQDNPGEIAFWSSVYDGHGGYATADWLEKRLKAQVDEIWRGGPFAQSCIEEAFRKADATLLQSKRGFMGIAGERGVGGSKCGATQTTAMIYTDKKDGKVKLLTANVGDGRVLLISGNKYTELFQEHVPDDEDERERIERMNPNPKMPLVRYTAGTWRVGGLLALSRAFGDAYLKSSLQFEGVPLGSDGYSSGFGVTAEPFVTITELTSEHTWVLVASDGLFNEVQRGGGGGLSNEDVTEILYEAGDAPADAIAETLCETAQEVGSTDDITVTLIKLDTTKLPAPAPAEEPEPEAASSE